MIQAEKDFAALFLPVSCGLDSPRSVAYCLLQFLVLDSTDAVGFNLGISLIFLQIIQYSEYLTCVTFFIV